MLNTLTEQLRAGTDLNAEQIAEVVSQMTAEDTTPEIKAKFLTALAEKGETTEELAAFASELREMATVVPLDKATRADEMLDVCGTGGDGLNTFNISTTVAILCAAAGVTVAKHGNRAITSKSGSADVLDALGIPTDLSPTDAAAAIAEHGFAFLFAPLYHPAFKHIAPARALCAERGQRTLFNFLGPLLNPARPTAQLIGVPRIELTKPMAKVLQHLGIQRGMVVCGRVGEQQMDELSTLGETSSDPDRSVAGSIGLALAVGRLQRALGNGSAYENVLVSLRALSAGDGTVSMILDRLAVRATTGAPTRDALLQSFPGIARNIVATADTEAARGWTERTWHRIRNTVSIRRIGADVPGDTPGAQVARAEAKLNVGDLGGAVAELGGLTGAAATTAATWLVDAQSRRDVEVAVGELEALAIARLQADSGGS